MTLSDAFAEFVRYQREERGFSQFTITRTLTFQNQMVGYFGDLYVAELTEPMLKQFQRELYLACKSPVTYYNRVVDIRRLVKFLHLRGKISVSPDHFPTPRKTEVEKDWLTPCQIRQMIEAIPLQTVKQLRDAAIISLLAASGMRVGELVSLTARDIGQEGSISVVGKGNRRRCVFVPQSTLERITAHFNAKQRDEAQQDGQSLFGVTRKCVYNITKRWGLIALGKPVNPHMLRHSFATNMATADMEVTTIAKLMGHVDISTTTRYLHYADGRLHNLYQRHSVGWGY